MFYKILLYIKNEWTCWFNLLSKKQRHDTKQDERLLWNDKDKEKWLREKARGKYRNLSEEEKNKKGEYGKNRYHNMSEW